MEAAQRREPDTRDINNAESEEVEVKEVAEENVVEEHLLRVVVRLGSVITPGNYLGLQTKYAW
jgi:hypothetical protein